MAKFVIKGSNGKKATFSVKNPTKNPRKTKGSRYV